MKIDDLKVGTLDDIRIYVKKLQTLIVIEELIEKLCKVYKLSYTELLDVFSPLIDFLDIKL